MKTLPFQFEELADLVWALVNDRLDAAGATHLEQLLDLGAANRRVYLELMDQFASLEWEKAKNDECGMMKDELPADVKPADALVSTDHSSFVIHHSDIPDPEPLIAPIIIDSSPTIHYPLFTIHSPLGGWLISYTAATVITGMAILGMWTYKVSHNYQLATADSSRGLTAPGVSSPGAVSSRLEEPEYVGRITGTVDCKFSDDKDILPPPGSNAFVPLERKYALASGLMEITYTTGAKVILQGPCIYEVDSAAGGFLSLGKLTARVEKSEISNPQSLIPNPQFVVKTPTAIVTDLGTEFGVEVGKEGTTTSRVFRGSVRVQATSADGEAEGVARVLRENESARVEVLRENESAPVESSAGNRVTVLGPSAKPPRFVRDIEPTIKTLDLVDVVAGGDGFSGRRNRGIDPTNGRVVDQMTGSADGNPYVQGDGQYHRVAGMSLIDGVFIPDGGKDEVQTDSSGRTFAGFHGTVNFTSWLRIWAGIPTGPDYPTKVGGTDYASPGHGQLMMIPNKGITFDLEAVRRADPGSRPLRFRAVAANTGEMPGPRRYADVWVLVDAERRYQRRLSKEDGVVPVLVPIGDKDRFLTLAATDANDGIDSDWVMFGDPRLELLQADADGP